MSIARQLFHDLRPLVRMLEEPLSHSSAYYGLSSRSLFDDPFISSPSLNRPAMDVTEEGNTYVLEADLPGVKKEDVEVRIGDGGRSVTIEGRTVHKRSGSMQGDSQASANTAGAGTEGSNSTPQSNQISTERSLGRAAAFTRTAWLPRPVDGSNVAAKLSDGILTIRLNKAEDRASIRVPIE